MVSQASLLGIRGALGMSPWWLRLGGIVVGVGFLVPLLGIGIHEVNWATFIVVAGATSVVTVPLLIVRSFRVAIHLGASPVEPTGRIQFSIRHLMILTFVVACVVAIGKLIQPHFPQGDVSFELLLFALTFGVVGVLPVWCILATRQPILYGLGLVAVGACAGFLLGRGQFDNVELWMTATTIEVISVIVSLFVVRSCGYRLVRLPRSGGSPQHRSRRPTSQLR